MLVLALTFTLAVLVLGPDLLLRWILGFVVPRRSLSLNRGEEITRALLWVAAPLAVTWGWLRFDHVYAKWGSPVDVQIVVSAFYSSSFFDTHSTEFFRSLPRVAGMYWSTIWRLYILVLLLAALLNTAIVKFRWLRHSMKWGWAKRWLATLVLPGVSEWHVLFSDMLLPKEDVTVAVDVLTKTGTLYQGGVQDRMLGTDGSLQSLTLSDPRRFQRDDFQKAKEADPATKADAFWRTIPSKLFVIMGSDIANVNVRYIPKVALKRRELSEDEINSVRVLLSRLIQPEQET